MVQGSCEHDFVGNDQAHRLTDTSGRCGDMTRITSAPKATNPAHNAGAAMTLANSTTLISAGGRLSFVVENGTGGFSGRQFCFS